MRPQSAQSPHRRGTHKRIRSLLSATASTLVTCLVALGLVFVEPVAAQAAATPGAGGYWTPAGGWLGNYIVGGKRVYCIDVLTDTAGSGGSGTLVSSITEAGRGTRPVSGADLQKINYAVSVWGQTSDPIQAAAVGAYVYNFVSANWHGSGEHYITGPNAAAILLRYQQIKADTAQKAALGVSTGSGALTLEIDPANHSLGTLRVSALSPANAVGTITLVNGVFADTGLATRDSVSNNSSFAVIGVPPAGVPTYRISATAAFRGSGQPVYKSNVTVYAEGSMQRTVGSGQSASGVVNFSLTGADAADRSTVFLPEVGTRVASEFVADGEQFEDVLTFATVADASGLHNPWFWREQEGYLEVRAIGTIYGPFLARPDESAAPPPSAPVFADGIELVTSAQHGPTIDYTVRSGVTADEPGFYTWVWRITSAEQTSATAMHLPSDYHYQDRFGIVAETSITPTLLTISTQLLQTEVTVGEQLTDEVTVGLHAGGWLQADGGRVPATLTGTAYFSETEPVVSVAPPPGAEVVGTTTLVVNRPTTATSEPITMPLKEGYVTFQWCLLEAEQPVRYRGMLRETCDSYGQASETVRLVVPTVVTQAKPKALPGEQIYDVAVIQGATTEHMVLEFSLYAQQPFVEAPSCTAENLVHTSDRVSLAPAEHDGTRYMSPSIDIHETGMYWWVERLLHIDPVTYEESVLHSGICALAAETSMVYVPLPSTGAATPTAGLVAPVASVLFGGGAVLFVASVVQRQRSRRVRQGQN